MVKRFNLKTLLNNVEIEQMVDTFHFRKRKFEEGELQTAIQAAFSDYIFSALDELGDTSRDRKKIYLEANFHLDKAHKLLEGMPHPVGKMSYRLSSMQKTLNKLIEGKDNFASERASRFMEKNLIRKLRSIWELGTSQSFQPGNSSGKGEGSNPRDFITFCLSAAGKQYPEIEWFENVDSKLADKMIRSIR